MTMIKDKLDELINNTTKSGNVNARRILKLFKAELIDYTLREIKDSQIKVPNNLTDKKKTEYISNKKKEMRTLTYEVEINILQKLIKKLNDELAYAIRLNRYETVNEVNDQLLALKELLPPQPSENEIVEFINNEFPSGFVKKQMRDVITSVKNNFPGIDGGLVAKLCSSLAK